MRPDDHRVAGADFAVRLKVAVVISVLHAQATELAGVILEKRRCRSRRAAEIVERRTGKGAAHAVAAELRVAQAEPPLRHELIDALHIESAAIEVDRNAVERALFVAEEVFAVHDQIVDRRIAARRPFVDEAQDPELILARENVSVDVAVLRLGLEKRGRGKPTALFVQVAAGLHERRDRARTVVVGVRRGKGVAAEPLGAKLQEEVRRRDPAQPDAVIAILRPQERTVRQRRIHEVPVVRVPLVEIGDTRKEPPGLRRQTPRQARGLDERFFDGDGVVVLERDREIRHEYVVDIRRQHDLRFVEREAAIGKPRLLVQRKARNPCGRRIVFGMVVRTVKRDGNRGIERAGARCGPEHRRRSGWRRCGHFRHRLSRLRVCRGRGGGFGAFGARFGLLQPLLQRADLLFIVAAQRFHFLANGGQVVIGGGRGQCGRRSGTPRESAEHGCRESHEDFSKSKELGLSARHGAVQRRRIDCRSRTTRKTSVNACALAARVTQTCGGARLRQ